MRALRRLLPILIACIALVGCGRGSGSPVPARTAGAVALVGNTAISPRSVLQYMNYALRFYSWLDATQSGDGATSCSIRSVSPACVTLRNQVSRRLVEERVVATYAGQHGIRLSSSDSTRVERELKQLQTPNSSTARLFTTERISPAFMRAVLQNQLLVKRVEAVVVAKAALSGPSFRLRKFVFALDRRSYQSAVDLATSGTNGSPVHRSSVHWVASFRLAPRVRSLIELASNGDYVGPTLDGPSYVVYQVLRRGKHRYGLPAREVVEARDFRAWLSRHMTKTGL